MARNWAASLTVAVVLLGCTEGAIPAGDATPGGAEARSASQGWMGRFSRRDPALATLLQQQPGWTSYRDMELFEAIQAFASSKKPADRLGAARSYLCLADLFGALDSLFLEVEAEFLSGLELEPDAPARVRRAYVWLRRGELDRARPAFEAQHPGAGAFPWLLGRAGLAAVEGRAGDAKRLGEQVPPPADDAEKILGQVACFLWGVPCAGGGRGPYGQAIAAFRRGDLAGGIMALQMLDLQSGGEGAEPGLFLYPLLRRAFAGLALAAVGEPATVGEAFLAGRAREHLGEWENSAQLFSRAAAGDGPGLDPAWLFSPYHGEGDAAHAAQVLRGGAMYRAGRAADALGPWREVVQGTPGPLALAWLAALQAELGLSEPLGVPENAAASALAAVAAAPEGFVGDGAEVLASLYPARQAAVSRLVARVYRKAGDRRRAEDVLDRAHRKASGYRPDFTSPPGYLVDLAREYAACGEYAPAVAVLFELAGDYPSARLGYESLKRLYASRTGGEVPPR